MMTEESDAGGSGLDRAKFNSNEMEM